MSRKNIEEVCGYLDESFESDSDSLSFVDDRYRSRLQVSE